MFTSSYYTKAIYSLVVTLLTTWLAAGISTLDRTTIWQLAIMLVAAVGTWALKNTHGTVLAYTKFAVEAVGAVLTILAPIVLNHGQFTPTAVVLILSAIAKAFGVYLLPNNLSGMVNPTVVALPPGRHAVPTPMAPPAQTTQLSLPLAPQPTPVTSPAGPTPAAAPGA